MDFLRTDDRCFNALPDYDFQPRYIEVDDFEGGSLRMHYVDEGSHPSETILCMHGEPSWCFLYRHIIHSLVKSGYRVIAPDLIGFGRSDKPIKREDHTYQRHVDWTRNILEQLDIENVTLFCHDWGGLIGLRLVAEQPARFKRVITANTSLPTGEGNPSQAFLKWRELSQRVAKFPVGEIVKGACVTNLSAEVVAGYNAPFPDESYKAGVRQMPLLVPISTDDPASGLNKRAWKLLYDLELPWLTAFSDQDPITRNGEKYFQRRIKGAKNQPHVTIKNAGHFLQEDKGIVVAKVIDDFISST